MADKNINLKPVKVAFLPDYFCLKWVNFIKKIRCWLKKLFRPHLPVIELSDKALLGLTGQSFPSCEALISHLNQRERPQFFFDRHARNQYPKLIAKRYPESIPATIAEADQICKHVFDLLGYRKLQLPPVINWISDPISGVAWPDYYLNIDCEDLEHSTDMRICWELSRFKHFLTLGKAYWYTNDEKYTQEFVHQLLSWIENNPAEWGANWTCAMESAIRSINWIWAYYFFLDSAHFTPDIQLKLIKSLIQHARHIWGNLEGTPYGRFGNHYLADALGLLCLGIFFSDFKISARWRNQGLAILWREAEKQIHSDGVDYEQSIDYHRQVSEFLLLAIVLCRKNNIPVPPQVEQQTEKMLQFLKSCTRPDGSLPMIGDADNGTLWSKKAYGHLDCLAAGAVIFLKTDFVDTTTDFPEAAFWLLGVEGLNTYNALPSPNNLKITPSQAYTESGFYIMRNKELHLIMHCGEYGSHGHSDLLSLDLFAHGQHFIADPGTYTYTGSYEWRNYFRSTFSHSTIVVDEQEFHPLSKATLWEIAGRNKYRIISWKSSDEYDYFDAEHFCYHRLNPKVTHRRQVLFIKQGGYFIINDLITGSGSHRLELIFNLAPLKIELQQGGAAKCSNDEGAYVWIIPDNAEQPQAKLCDSWISYVYGHKQPIKKIVYIKFSPLPGGFFTIIHPGTIRDTKKPEKIKEIARKAWNDFTTGQAIE
jgi:hypothetical protein